jgi:hypothetical protein
LEPVVQNLISVILTRCFGLCISERLFISKFQKMKLLSIQAKYLKKYFLLYKQAVGMFALKFSSNLTN